MTSSSLNISSDTNEGVDEDDDPLKWILFPVLSPDISPMRPSTTSSPYRHTNLFESLFVESCAQVRQHRIHQHWPFCPIYMLQINTYCHFDCFAIPAEVALVEATFWPQLYGGHMNLNFMNLSKNVFEHYEHHSNLYKPLRSITASFHDFVHPGDQLPIGFQADILEHSRRTHGLPCTPHEKIGTEDYNQLIDDLNEMLCSLCDSHDKTHQEPMPMFCAIESFWSTKAALDWLYDQPSTRDRPNDYTLYPIEALIAVIYEDFYDRVRFKCDLGVLMSKTPQQPVLHSRACDYHAILENKHCAMAHVRDLAKYYLLTMAYLFYTHCDQNSSALLPYIKTTYRGNLALQQAVYWSNRKDRSKYLMSNNRSVRNNVLVELPSLPSLSRNSRNKSFENHKNTMKSKTKHNNQMAQILCSNLNPLAVPFTLKKDKAINESYQHADNVDKRPAELVLFEPGKSSSRQRSCHTIHQRLHHQPRENWDEYEPSNWT